jgi:hypothetical protein
MQPIEYCNDTLQLKTTIEKGFLMMGERLYKIRAEKLYSPQWSSFAEYLEEFGNMSQGTASKLINVYLRFVKEFEIDESKLLQAKGWTNLAKIAAISRTKEEAEEWVDKAIVLTARDLDREITEYTKGTDMIKCEHKHDEVMLLHTCIDCKDQWTTPFSNS